MKRIIKGLITLILFIPLLTASQSWQWSIGMGGVSTDESFDMVTLPTGISYITGSFSGTAQFDTISVSCIGSNFFLAKINKEGRVLWVKQGGGSGYDAGKAVDVDDYGNVYVTGTFEGNLGTFDGEIIESLGYKDIFLNKYNSDGLLLWTQHAGSFSGNVEVTDIDVDKEGQAAITGYTKYTINFFDYTNSDAYHYLSFPNTTLDCFVAKYKSNSIYIGSYRLGSTTGNDNSKSIQFDPAGNVILTGIYKGEMTVGATTLTLLGLQDIYIIKFNQNLQLVWVKKAGSTGTDEVSGLRTDLMGNIFLSGNFITKIIFDSISLTSKGKRDIYLSKYSPEGKIIWAKNEGGANTQMANDLDLDTKGNSYVLGNFETSAQFGDSTYLSKGSNDIFIAKFDSSGNAGWSIHAGTIQDDAPRSISIDNDSNIYVTGVQLQPIPFGMDTTEYFAGKDIFVSKWLYRTPLKYVFNGNGKWSVAANWQNNLIPPASVPKYDSIIIHPQPADSCILDTTVAMEDGSYFIVANQSKLVIPLYIARPYYDTTFTDPRDGQVYPVKRYNNKIWMTKNLNYKSALSKVYNNDTSHASVYGRLYDWNGAMAAVPAGWHLPSREEWNDLIKLSGGEIVGAGPLKDTLYWQLPNTASTNSSGFNARPGGIYEEPYFEDLGYIGYWWTSTEISSVGTFNWAYYFTASYNTGRITSYEEYKWAHFISVRCVKD